MSEPTFTELYLSMYERSLNQINKLIAATEAHIEQERVENHYYDLWLKGKKHGNAVRNAERKTTRLYREVNDLFFAFATKSAYQDVGMEWGADHPGGAYDEAFLVHVLGVRDKLVAEIEKWKD